MTEADDLIVLPEALFDGEAEAPLGDRAIVIEGGRIRDVAATVRALAGRVLRTVSTTPAEALGLGSELGRIAPGQRASVTLLTHDMEACGTIVDGQLPDGVRASG